MKCADQTSAPKLKTCDVDDEWLPAVEKHWAEQNKMYQARLDIEVNVQI